MKGLLKAFLFGNYFYGLCAIALSIETSLLLFQSFHSFSFYLLIFNGTVIYYTYAYIKEPIGVHKNARTIWYFENKLFIKYSQLLMTVVFLIAFLDILFNNLPYLVQISILQWILIMVFPFIAVFYYSSSCFQSGTTALRNIGWLKPIVIAFVWSGIVSIYPLFFNSIENNISFTLSFYSGLLFLNNLLFITPICIMFDIKDYAADHNQQVKTFVVRYGLRSTIISIIMPINLIGLGTNIIYGIVLNNTTIQIIINIFPFILLIIVAYSLYQRKSILYYLAIIDGLILIKAIFGIIGQTLTK